MKQFFSAEDTRRLQQLCSSGATAAVENVARLGSRYLEKLLSFNRVVPLISRGGDQQSLAVQLFLSSLAALEFIPQESKITLCDLGSGGGFPAIPLKIARPDTSWLLLESKERKCAFLESIVQDLKLTEVNVVCGRFEEFTPPPGAKVSVVTARAGPSLEDVLRWARKISSLTEVVFFLPANSMTEIHRIVENHPFYLAGHKTIRTASRIEDLEVVAFKKTEM